MTWIVGTSSIFGYAAAVSDIQVTSSGGRHLDCLQKVYLAIPIVAFGFSGSVRIGFVLLHDFQTSFLRGLSTGEARPVRICAHDWYRRARWIFKQQPTEERQLGSSIMLLGVSPQEQLGQSGFPRADVVVLESRGDFEPHYVKRLECVGIGSGNDVDDYVKEIELRNRSGGIREMEFEAFMPHGQKLAFDVAYALKKFPHPGVSRYVQHTVISGAGVSVNPPQAVRGFGLDGHPVDDPAPSIARSWSEFCTLATSHGFSSAGVSG